MSEVPSVMILGQESEFLRRYHHKLGVELKNGIKTWNVLLEKKKEVLQFNMYLNYQSESYITPYIMEFLSQQQTTYLYAEFEIEQQLCNTM